MSAWDVIVVGAGPAGAAAALAVLDERPRSRVLLLDREDFPRDKACGDGVAQHIVDLLTPFGLGGIVDDFAPARDLVLASKTVSVRRPLVVPLWGVPRRVFDRRLVEAAVSRGAILARRTVRSVQRDGDRVVVDGELDADVVIGADGAESVVRRQLGTPLNGSGHVALAIRGYRPSSSASARLLAPGHEWLAYGWEFPLGTGISNVGYGEVLRGGKKLTKQVLLERLEDVLPGATVDAGDWRAARLPLSTSRPRLPNGRVLLVGDAASLVNPMSGEGIYLAVLSGMLAGRAAAGGQAAGACYRRSLRSAVGRHIRHTKVIATGGAVGSMPLFGLRMVAADPEFFDNQVEVSIGGGTYRPVVSARAIVKGLLYRAPNVQPR